MTDEATGAQRDPALARTLVADAFRLYRPYPLLLAFTALATALLYFDLVARQGTWSPGAELGNVGPEDAR